MYVRACLPNHKPMWISEKIDIKEHFHRLVKQREDFEDRRRPRASRHIRTSAGLKKSSVESADPDNVPRPRPSVSSLGSAEPVAAVYPNLGLNLGSNRPSDPASADPDIMSGSSVSISCSAEPVVALGFNLSSHQPSEPQSSTPKPSDRSLKILDLYADFLDPKLGLGIGRFNLGSQQPLAPESNTPKPELQPLVGRKPIVMPNPSARSLKTLDLYADFRLPTKRVGLICNADPVAIGKVSRQEDVGPAVTMALPAKLMKEFPENSSLRTIIIAKTPVGQKVRKRIRPRIKNVLYQDNGKFDTKAKADLIPSRTLVVVVRLYWPNQPKCQATQDYLTHAFITGKALMANQRTSRDKSAQIPIADCKWRRRRVKPKLSQVIVMLGSQTLDNLRDMIRCTVDGFTPEECSKRRGNVPSHTNKDVYKSGFFFINDAFFNDFRSPQNFDYSEVIRKWAERKELGPFETYRMESTKMEDLTVQLGQPYLYQHQGHCEHLFVISDIHLLSYGEPRSLKAYPYVLYEALTKVQKCFMCGSSLAYWSTKGDIRLPYQPCYFCNKCDLSFNYVDGKPASDFKAYYSNGPIFKGK